MRDDHCHSGGPAGVPKAQITGVHGAAMTRFSAEQEAVVERFLAEKVPGFETGPV